MNKENVADKILVIRAFTVSQVLKLLVVELPKLIKKYQIKSIVIPGLLNSIDEEQNMRAKEAKRAIGKMMKAITETSSKVLVIASVQEGRYKDWVLPEFQKQIVLGNMKLGRMTAKLCNNGRIANLTLTERELKIVPRK